MLYKCPKCNTICGPLDENTAAIVIEIEDSLRNISYLTVSARRGAELTSARGVPLALANEFGDRAVEVSLRLAAADTVDEALAICRECVSCPKSQSFRIPNWLNAKTSS